MKPIIRDLSQLNTSEIADAFLAAFADYNTKFDRTALEALLIRRGADMSLSFGAFDNDQLISFIFNGIGLFDGVPSAYDSGTGTIKEYRGLRLTDKIFEYTESNLIKAGIKQYVLEVIKDNIPAFKIYSRHGFEVNRELICYGGLNKDVIAILTGRKQPDVELKKANVGDILPLASFMDFIPSWQNSKESLLRNPEAFTVLIAVENGNQVGYGVSETAFGDITQIAVAPEYRRKGIGSRILLELIKNIRIEHSKVLNIDDTADGMKKFLIHSGYNSSCVQYEMVKSLF